MSKFDQYKEVGIDVEDALQRFMNNEALFIKMMGKLPDAVRKLNVTADFSATDYEQTVQDAHAIKGMTGNLSVTPLYKAYTKIVNLLREDKPEEARQVLIDILPVQEKIFAVIEGE